MVSGGDHQVSQWSLSHFQSTKSYQVSVLAVPSPASLTCSWGSPSTRAGYRPSSPGTGRGSTSDTGGRSGDNWETKFNDFNNWSSGMREWVSVTATDGGKTKKWKYKKITRRKVFQSEKNCDVNFLFIRKYKVKNNISIYKIIIYSDRYSFKIVLN